MADRGLLSIYDPERAALHFLLLISASSPPYRAAVLSEPEITERVASGVHAFLHGYIR